MEMQVPPLQSNMAIVWPKQEMWHVLTAGNVSFLEQCNCTVLREERVHQSIGCVILNNSHSANRTDKLIWIIAELLEECWSLQEQ